jgi:hypothetical protein
MHVALVPCSTGDKDFAFRVTEEAIRAYVEEAFGVWDASDQRRRLEESFDPSIYRLIVVDRVRAGILAGRRSTIRDLHFKDLPATEISAARDRLYSDGTADRMGPRRAQAVAPPRPGREPRKVAV